MRARLLDGELACTTELFNVVKQTYKDNEATMGALCIMQYCNINGHIIHTCFTIGTNYFFLSKLSSKASY
jgi:hypothetical protein